MLKTVIAATFAMVVVASAARAQQPEDPRINVYRQLLIRAQDELSQAGAQLQAAQTENAHLKAELAKKADKPGAGESAPPPKKD